MYVISGCIQDIHIHQLPYIFRIQGTVSVRNNKSTAGNRTCRLFNIQVPFVIFIFYIIIPQLKEHPGEASDSFSFHHHCRILPVAKTFFFVDIFICQINTAGKCRFAIDNRYFSVVTVILGGGKSGLYGIEFFTLNPLRLKLLGITVREQRYRAGSVVHEPHLHTLPGFLFKNLMNRIPHTTFRHNKIFHENKFFSLFQLLNQCFELFLPQREIFHFTIIKRRKSSFVHYISCKIAHLTFFLIQLFQNLWILFQKMAHSLGQFIQARIQNSYSNLCLHKNIKHHTKYRCNDHRHHPRQFKSRITGPVYNHDCRSCRKQCEYTVGIECISLKFFKQQK